MALCKLIYKTLLAISLLNILAQKLLGIIVKMVLLNNNFMKGDLLCQDLMGVAPWVTAP